jgi:hypothetical protein
VHGQNIQALAAARDRIELRETLQELQQQLSQYTGGSRSDAPHNLSRDRATEVLNSVTNVGLLSRVRTKHLISNRILTP